MTPNDWLIVVPARLASERLPSKPLLDLGGKPLIVRVMENLLPLHATGVEVVAAVDDERTLQVCQKFGLHAVMTSAQHQSGTDRCAEVAREFPARKFILNVQGDEPFVKLDDLKNLMELMESKTPKMATLGYPSSDLSDFTNPNIVKIVLSSNNEAIYFSRAPVPHDRNGIRDHQKTMKHLQHLGIYAFSQDSIHQFCQLPPSELELIEKLEQLRALDAGWKILVTKAGHKSIGIDTPEDLKLAQKVFHG